ncbi:MAG: hypothetical protein K2O82_05255 [Alistipes sp.]|nr:hypothetical protein [Alistipes sp.]
MYSVSSELYGQVAASLAEAIGASNYFSGSVDAAADGVAWRLTASVIVYRRRVSLPEGEEDAIVDLVPVWWEFHTVAPDGEMLNDFSFDDLRNAIRNS